MAGHLDAPLRNLWGSCITIALTKRAGGYRPVSMGNVERRVTGRAVLQLPDVRGKADTRFRGYRTKPACNSAASPRTDPNRSSTTSTYTSSSTQTTL
jgi:hypothetical protein